MQWDPSFLCNQLHVFSELHSRMSHYLHWDNSSLVWVLGAAVCIHEALQFGAKETFLLVSVFDQQPDTVSAPRGNSLPTYTHARA